MQEDFKHHIFKENVYFEDVVDLYNFDRHFRLEIFKAVERIEIELRTKLINHMSLEHGVQWQSLSKCRSPQSNNFKIKKKCN